MVPDAVGKTLVRGWRKASLMPIRRLPIFFLSTTSRLPVHPAPKLNKRKPEGTRAPKTSLRFLSSGAISSRTGAAESNFPAQDTSCKQGGAFANRSSRHRRLLEKDKQRFGSRPDHEPEGAGCDSQHNERPEMMILRLATQCAFFFHGLGYSSSGKASSCGSRASRARRLPAAMAGTVRQSA